MGILYMQLRPDNSFGITLPVLNALPTNPYILKEVDGLGSPEVDVFLANSLNSGGLYQGRRPQNRELVLRVGLNPSFSEGETSASLRKSIYLLLSPEKIISLWIRGDSEFESIFGTIDLKIDGYIRRIEAVPFSKEPLVQITIACTQPYIEAAYDTGVVFLPEDPLVVEYYGTANVGFEAYILINEPLPYITLHKLPYTTEYMEVFYDFVIDDVVYFNTKPGSRKVVLTRGAADFDITGYLIGGNSWTSLAPGENTLVITGGPVYPTPDVYLQSFSYRARFWGL